MSAADELKTEGLRIFNNQKISRPKNYDWDGYSINLYLDEDGDWLAHFVEMSNVSAFGDTPEIALDELYEAWEGMKECYVQDGEEIPIAYAPASHETDEAATNTLIAQLQQQYRSIIQQITRLRQTASALEGILGRDRHCQSIQAEAIAQLKLLEVETKHVESLQDEQIDSLWNALDAAAPAHPEAFQESLQQLLPDLSDRSEIEIDLLSKLVLACGDVSLVNFVKISPGAIAAARDSLKSGCQIVTDAGAIAAAVDYPRLAHLGCQVDTLIDNPHITTAAEAEQEFWQHQSWQKRFEQLTPGCILVVGYAPSVLISVCQGIEKKFYLSQ